jgi:cytochrome b
LTAIRAATRDWRIVARAWGREGNERLTALVGLVLLVLLAVEAWTTFSLHSYLPLHMFLGFVLLPPVALKLASTGWRAARYYTGSRPYRRAGPPRLPLRLLAPLLVASTLALFASGVALVVVGHGRGWILTVHATSFAVWGVLMAVHVVAYVARTFRRGTADLRRRTERIVPGARIRRALLGGALVAGVLIALAAYPAQQRFHTRAHEGSNVSR